jgi:sec-independent protein translocase protein TatA
VIEDLLTPYHLLILFALLFFLFGAKRLPGLGKSLGHGIREFRGGLAGLAADHDDELPEAAPEAAADEHLALAAADGSRTLVVDDEPPRPA